MVSADGRWVISYNGEIYNHADLRAEIEAAGHAPPGGWRGHSDTETLLQAISVWGLQHALAGSVGMFAFSLWDRQQRRLSLVRDRFGEKPLYYGWAGRDFVFGSELKALRKHPDFDGEIDREALSDFVSLTYIPAPRSIYRNIFKLEPACILTIDEIGARQKLSSPPAIGESGAVRATRYWDYREIVGEGLDRPYDNEAEALAALDRSLEQAIRGQAVADVPVGAFLSGGIDSSTVVALYQKYSSTPVRTFSIGFEEAGYDEARDAGAVAAYLGTEHEEHYVTAGEARNIVPILPTIYDEPFADSSQIPTYLVSRFARHQVTVALTGDGGDELFAGYNRHFLVPAMWRNLRRIPMPVRKLAKLGARLPQSALSAVSSARSSRPDRGAKLRKALKIAGASRQIDDVYSSLLDEWDGEPSPVLNDRRNPRRMLPDHETAAPDEVRIMLADATGYLPDDILTKVDRASMAVSLETRVPFLDHRVAATAARIPIAMQVGGRQGKKMLRKILHREVPERLVDRPKTGFAVPVGQWIRQSPLRSWAEELLDPTTLGQDGLLDPQIVDRRWRDHLTGRRDSTAAIWAILMFQAWLRDSKA
jgi:asparagine synthase (glutamine-hydrolysing)